MFRIRMEDAQIANTDPGGKKAYKTLTLNEE